MPGRNFKYLFGRLNIIAAYNEDKADFLWRGLSAGITHRVRDHEWGFFEVSELQERQFITGFLAKYQPTDSEEYIDPETQEIEERNVTNRIEAKSRFFLHVKTGILAYQKNSQIEIKTFRDKFREVMKACYSNFFIDVDIQQINEEKTFFEAIKKFSSIKKIRVKLHPSNPNSRDIWEDVDNDLQRRRIRERTEITVFDGEEGQPVNIDDDAELNARLHMASDGYGVATIDGVRGGQTERVRTGDNPVEAEVENSVENTSSEPTPILDQLISTFRSLFNRMQNPE
ncbi:hypothetical protein [Picosynechococcus sp. PCC 8807]|uniref:hypothetical protein n=1 Tax=Picosynechococcus sp. PCC 8807 TaxID=195248 RepID=UPI0008105DF5|nr:hypothetical protein [Picosynechococcus sp. PCC 8807]ANV92078.1 hypothetical protein AWQ24_14965 [Picosynechococcus sp. PCC 8807]